MIFDIPLTEREAWVVRKLAKEKDMTIERVVVQALRMYQLVHERQKEGETFSFSGDAKRAREFRGEE